MESLEWPTIIHCPYHCYLRLPPSKPGGPRLVFLLAVSPQGLMSEAQPMAVGKAFRYVCRPNSFSRRSHGYGRCCYRSQGCSRSLSSVKRLSLCLWNLARISHQPSATTIESSRHPKGIPCSSTLKCEYTSASDSRREPPGLTGASPSRDEVGLKAGLVGTFASRHRPRFPSTLCLPFRKSIL